MAKNGAVYTRKIIAKLLELSEKRIRQLTQEGVIEEYSAGYYRLVPTVQRYIKYLRSQIADGDQASNYNVEKAKLTRAKREAAEMDLKLRKNELHRAEDVEFVVTNMLVAFKARLLTMPYKILPELLNVGEGDDKKDEVVDILNRAVEECLEELAGYEPGMFSEEGYSQHFQGDD